MSIDGLDIVRYVWEALQLENRKSQPPPPPLSILHHHLIPDRGGGGVTAAQVNEWNCIHIVNAVTMWIAMDKRMSAWGAEELGKYNGQCQEMVRELSGKSHFGWNFTPILECKLSFTLSYYQIFSYSRRSFDSFRILCVMYTVECTIWVGQVSDNNNQNNWIGTRSLPWEIE